MKIFIAAKHVPYGQRVNFVLPNGKKLTRASHLVVPLFPYLAGCHIPPIRDWAPGDRLPGRKFLIAASIRPKIFTHGILN